jgi:hypothetical protein
MGSNHSLTLDGMGAVSYRHEGCFGGYTLSGTFAMSGSRLKLEIPNLKAKAAFPSEYNLIRWGKTAFLLADDEIPHFIYKLRTGWRGASDEWGRSNFMRNDLNRAKRTPAPSLPGWPSIPPAWQAEFERKNGFIVIHCAWENEGPLNCGSYQLIAEGVLLSDKDRKTLAWVESTEKETAWVRPLYFGKLKAGLKLEASIPPAFWRQLVQRERARLDQSKG